LQIESLLRIEDFVQTTKPDGTVVYTHKGLKDSIELESGQSPLWFFLKIREFSEKHGVLMCPEMAKLSNGLYEDFHQGLERHERELSASIDRLLDEEFEDEFDSEIFGDDDGYF
jgi:hypothetical protein